MRYTSRYGRRPNRRTGRRFVVRHDGGHSLPPEPTRSPLWSATIDRGRSRIGPDAALPDRARPTRSSIRYPTAHRSGSTRPPRGGSLSTVSSPHVVSLAAERGEVCSVFSAARLRSSRRGRSPRPSTRDRHPNASPREYAPLRRRDRGVRSRGPCAVIRDHKSHPAIRNDSRGRRAHGGGSATTDRRERAAWPVASGGDLSSLISSRRRRNASGNARRISVPRVRWATRPPGQISDSSTIRSLTGESYVSKRARSSAGSSVTVRSALCVGSTKPASTCASKKETRPS